MSSNTSQTEQQKATKMPLEKKGEKNTLVCKRKLVPVSDDDDLDVLSEGGIPQDILDQLNTEMNLSTRQKRRVFIENETEANSDHSPLRSHRTDTESMSQRKANVDGVVKIEDNETVRDQNVDKPETLHLEKGPSVDLFKKLFQKSGFNMSSDLGPKANLTLKTQTQTWEKATKTSDAMSDNEVLKDSVQDLDKLLESLDPHKYASKDVEHLNLSSQSSPLNSIQNKTYLKHRPSLEYDDYEDEENKTIQSFGSTDEIDIRSSESKFRSYYIAAEEILWDYGIDKPSQLISARWSMNLIDCGPYSEART